MIRGLEFSVIFADVNQILGKKKSNSSEKRNNILFSFYNLYGVLNSDIITLRILLTTVSLGLLVWDCLGFSAFKAVCLAELYLKFYFSFSF